MSPSSVCYKVEPNSDIMQPSHMPSGVKSATTSFQFGIRSKLHHHAEKVNSHSKLRMSGDFTFPSVSSEIPHLIAIPESIKTNLILLD